MQLLTSGAMKRPCPSQLSMKWCCCRSVRVHLSAAGERHQSAGDRGVTAATSAARPGTCRVLLDLSAASQVCLYPAVGQQLWANTASVGHISWPYKRCHTCLTGLVLQSGSRQLSKSPRASDQGADPPDAQKYAQRRGPLQRLAQRLLPQSMLSAPLPFTRQCALRERLCLALVSE